MPHPVFIAGHRDHSRRVAFSGNIIDRRSEKRSPDCVATALIDPAVRLLLIGDGRALVPDVDDGRIADPWFSRADAVALGGDETGAILLGFEDDGAPRLAMPVTVDPDNPPPGFRYTDYRSIYIAGMLDEGAIGALAQGAALLAWHRSHKHCSRCGAESEMADGGYKRICPNCEAQHFPRTDPVVIMLTVSKDGDRALLGRSPHFPDGMYSCLAGFVEPGETLEDAVRRETREEAGVAVGAVLYHASQPWPFPYSMMIGMYGQAESDAIVVDDELDDARWFSRDEVRQMIAGTHVDGLRMPPRGAIAWRLVEDWVNDD